MKILVVDDEQAIRVALEMRLRQERHEVLLASDGASARKVLAEADPDLIVSDVCLPDASGVGLLEVFRSAEASVGEKPRPVILMTAYGTIDVAVEAMKRGAADFLTKPLDHARLRATIARLEQEVEFRRATSSGSDGGGRGFGALVGGSPRMRELYALIERLSGADASVLLCGESGTGKDVVARTIHSLSRRAKEAFVALNMSALPAGVVESELFGHARGSFTGAVAARPGAFELADRGTLFLDEIAEMPLELQPKLLRVLESGAVRPVGARAETQVDVRILAATNQDPETAMAQGKLREDLYYRLNVFTLTLPSLRARLDDIPLLARHFLAHFNQRHGASVDGLDDEALEAMLSHPWPGNVRELRNAVERAVILAGSGRLRREHLPPALQKGAGGTGGAPLVLPSSVTAAEAERLLILETLRQVRNNKAAAARRLGMDVKTIRNKLKGYGIVPDSE